MFLELREKVLADLKKVNPSRYVIYVGFLAILAFFSIALRDAGFATPGNLVNIVQQTAPVTVMAVGTVFVLTAGEIDLSICSVVAIAAVVAALVLRDLPGALSPHSRLSAAPPTPRVAGAPLAPAPL